MPAWEINDGRKVMGPMSEDAVIWAIKQGLPSGTRVREAGRASWAALDDHEAFAEELVSRTSIRFRTKPRIYPLGYTWQEFAALAVALGVVALMVMGVGWVEEKWQAVRKELKDRQEDPRLRTASVYLPLIAGEAPRPRDSASQESTPEVTLGVEDHVRQANAALNDTQGDGREAVCRARALLDPIAEAEKKKPEVERALSLLWHKEMPLLKQEQAEFEKGRGLVCADGTRPSGCPCKGAQEACCLFHGGAASCEPIPTRIRCF